MPLVKTVKYVADTKEAEKGIKKLTAEEKKRLAQMKETEKEQKDLIDNGRFWYDCWWFKAKL